MLGVVLSTSDDEEAGEKGMLTGLRALWWTSSGPDIALLALYSCNVVPVRIPNTPETSSMPSSVVLTAEQGNRV